MGTRTSQIWAQRVADLESSGHSVRAFADAIGVKPSTLSYWRWKLRQPEHCREEGLRVRLNEAESSRLKEKSGAAGVQPGRWVRRLIREALSGTPDYFEGQLEVIARAAHEVGKVGVNLNQLTRLANGGRLRDGRELKGQLAEVSRAVESLRAELHGEIARVRQRSL